jgi:hypothetical protein
MRARLLIVLVFCVLAGLGIFGAWRDAGRASSGWGIDACLTCHLPETAAPAYLRLLRGSDVRWLRERGSGQIDGPERRVWRAEQRAGFRVVAFAGLAHPVPVEQDGNQLPEDLLAVHRESANLGRETRGMVNAWEMVGEPDTFYCQDLPDRVAAYQKAVYLGLKDGSAEGASMVNGQWSLAAEHSPRVGGGAFPLNSQLPPSPHGLPAAVSTVALAPRPAASGSLNLPLVLSGAFGFPPGPWAELAGANGLYDYTDAINVHHYGFARDFADVVASHRAMAARWRKGPSLPVWVTEAGLNNIPYKDWENAAARRAQADYLLSCARQALAAKVAVFMPFILTHRGDPFSMTQDGARPYPSWTEYAAFTRTHRLPYEAPPVRPEPPRVVLQWLPDNLSCTPSKVARAYWFDSLEPGKWVPIEGELRVYNFSNAPVRARLELARTSPRVRVTCPEWPADRDLEIPALGCVKLPLTLTLEGAGYLRAALRGSARLVDGTTSPVEFFVGTPPSDDLPHETLPIALAAPETDHDFAYISEAPFEATGRNAQWLGINGARPGETQTADGFATFDVTDRNADPLSPPMAIARLPRGLPAARDGYLRVQARDANGRPAAVRVDVIDRDGERFSIVENLGRTPGAPTGDIVWLGYADFHPWVFGRCRPDAKFDPARAREIQLRFCDAGTGKEFQIRLDAVEFE